jgi:hypothetical protein
MNQSTYQEKAIRNQELISASLAIHPQRSTVTPCEPRSLTDENSAQQINPCKNAIFQIILAK